MKITDLCNIWTQISEVLENDSSIKCRNVFFDKIISLKMSNLDNFNRNNIYFDKYLDILIRCIEIFVFFFFLYKFIN